MRATRASPRARRRGFAARSRGKRRLGRTQLLGDEASNQVAQHLELVGELEPRDVIRACGRPAPGSRALPADGLGGRAHVPGTRRNAARRSDRYRSTYASIASRDIAASVVDSPDGPVAAVPSCTASPRPRRSIASPSRRGWSSSSAQSAPGARSRSSSSPPVPPIRPSLPHPCWHQPSGPTNRLSHASARSKPEADRGPVDCGDGGDGHGRRSRGSTLGTRRRRAFRRSSSDIPLRSAIPLRLPPAQNAPLPVRTTPHTSSDAGASFERFGDLDRFLGTERVALLRPVEDHDRRAPDSLQTHSHGSLPSFRGASLVHGLPGTPKTAPRCRRGIPPSLRGAAEAPCPRAACARRVISGKYDDHITLSRPRESMKRTSCSGRYFGAKPAVMRYTFGCFTSIEIVSSTHGSPT